MIMYYDILILYHNIKNNIKDNHPSDSGVYHPDVFFNTIYYTCKLYEQ